MMIEIVTHVYAETLPQYAAFLRVQLSSLVVNRPYANVQIGVCYTPSDKAVVAVLDEFRPLLADRLIDWPMTKKALFRRSIGRNVFAKSTIADLVWFTDVDHYWDAGCLDALAEIYQRNSLPPLIYPRTVLVPSDHGASDEFWGSIVAAKGPVVPDPFAMNWEPKVYRKAIGGVQIVAGWYCRQHGYLDGSKKWLKLALGTKPFPCFRDDVKFRKTCEVNGGARAIDLPGVRRLRHTATTYRS